MFDFYDLMDIVREVERFERIRCSRSCLKSTYVFSKHSKRDEIMFCNRIEILKFKKAFANSVKCFKAKGWPLFFFALRGGKKKMKNIFSHCNPSTRSLS